MDRTPKTGHPIVDTLLLLWSAIVSVASIIPFKVVEAGVGVTVGVLTCIMLIYRILQIRADLQEEEP